MSGYPYPFAVPRQTKGQKMKKLLSIGAVCLMGACSDAKRAHMDAYGKRQRVEIYSGGQLVREWTSTGQVENEGGSDGYIFNDSASNRLVRVSGSVVITTLKDEK